jgi:acyl carrier protein
MLPQSNSERMKQAEILEKCIYPVVEEMRPFATVPERFNPAPDVSLFGRDGNLDSLGLVTFLVAVEGRIEEETGRTVRLVSEKAMSRKHSPFRTVKSLAQYVEELLCESP